MAPSAAPTPALQPAVPTPPTAPAPPDRATAPSTGVLAKNETQVGRYTTVATQPDEADANPMAVIAKVHFPREVVSTVGDAVRYVLIRTGYQLVADDALDARVKSVFALRLPDNQRVLGPYRVDALLGVLMGAPYQLVADPAARTVTYVAPDAGGRAPVSLRPAAIPSPARNATGAATGPMAGLGADPA